MAEHTPGELHIFEAPFYDRDGKFCDTPRRLLRTSSRDTVGEIFGQKDARRLVACWNLLEHLPTKFIEAAAAELPDVEELGGYEIERLRIAITNAECVTPGG